MEDSPAVTPATLSRFYVGQGSLEETLHWVAELATVVIPPAVMIGITVTGEGGPRTTAYTDPLSPEIDQVQYDTGEGPCLDAMRDRAVMSLSSTREAGPWAAFRRAAAAHGILSTLSLPLAVDDMVIGAMNVYSPQERAFGPAEHEMAAEFAEQAAVLLANSHAYWTAQQRSDQLNEAMKTRAIIEQAKGVLMGAQGCNAEEAFDLLRRASQRENVKLREIARRIVERASGGDGER